MGRAGVTRAAVLVAPETIELHEFERPRAPEDGAVLRVEACGLCGTDIAQWHGFFLASGLSGERCIPGHEPVGVIEEIGHVAAARWRLAPGDRVAVEPHLSCGICAACLAGRRTACEVGEHRDTNYGFMSVDHESGLWGGYAEHLQLDPRTVLHRVSPRALAGRGIDVQRDRRGHQLGLACAVDTHGRSGRRPRVGPARPCLRDRCPRGRRGHDHRHRPGPRFRQARTRAVARRRSCHRGRRGGRRATRRWSSPVASSPTSSSTSAPAPPSQFSTRSRSSAEAGRSCSRAPSTVALSRVCFPTRSCSRASACRGRSPSTPASFREAVRLLERDAGPYARLHSKSFALVDAEAAIARLEGSDGEPPAVHVSIEPEMVL